MDEQNNLPPIPTGEELEAQQPTFLKDDEWFDVDIGESLLNVEKDIYMPPFTLSYNGSGFAPLSSVHAMSGQKKNGKTMTETLFMVALLRGEYMGLKCELDFKPSVLFIDTEMEEAYSLMVARRVHHLCGWDYKTPNPRFNVLWLRDATDTKDRWRKILKAIYTYRPTVVFLDGVRDVIDDINDGEKSFQLIMKIMNVATHYGCSVWCALHENQGSEKMRGWLGTELANKDSDTFVTRKTKDPGNVYFTVKQVDARGRDVDDIVFRVSDEQVRFGLPMIQGEDNQGPDLYSQFENFMAGLTLNTRDMRSKTAKAFKVNEAQATLMMSEAAEQGIVKKEPKPGSKTILWTLNKDYRNEQFIASANSTEEAPF